MFLHRAAVVRAVATRENGWNVFANAQEQLGKDNKSMRYEARIGDLGATVSSRIDGNERKTAQRCTMLVEHVESKFLLTLIN